VFNDGATGKAQAWLLVWLILLFGCVSKLFLFTPCEVSILFICKSIFKTIYFLVGGCWAAFAEESWFGDKVKWIVLRLFLSVINQSLFVFNEYIVLIVFCDRASVENIFIIIIQF
jgi:hypothetical protein